MTPLTSKKTSHHAVIGGAVEVRIVLLEQGHEQLALVADDLVPHMRNFLRQAPQRAIGVAACKRQRLQGGRVHRSQDAIGLVKELRVSLQLMLPRWLYRDCGYSAIKPPC